MTGQLSIPLPDEGVLFVVSGPSGVGKSTLVRRAMSGVLGLGFSVSATTRAARPGEQDGVDYHFLTPARFKELIAEDAFLEHAVVYDRAYGTLRSEVAASLGRGHSVILDIDVQGARQVRERVDDSVQIFVLPPSLEALKARLKERRTDDLEVITRRMAQASGQLSGASAYDYLVVNDDLDVAAEVFRGILLAELHRVPRRRSWLHVFQQGR